MLVSTSLVRALESMQGRRAKVSSSSGRSIRGQTIPSDCTTRRSASARSGVLDDCRPSHGDENRSYKCRTSRQGGGEEGRGAVWQRVG